VVQIPQHLIDDARLLAQQNLEQAIRNVRIIEASLGTNGEHRERARDNLSRARQLLALFQRPGSAAA